jgi:hypothetical protein
VHGGSEKTGSPRTGGCGHDARSHNYDRRAATEIILEERIGERDPEDRDGNLPELERPKRDGEDAT